MSDNNQESIDVNNVKELTCSICNKKYNVEEEPESIMLWDPYKKYVVCQDCFETIAKKHYQNVLAMGQDIKSSSADPLANIKTKAFNEFKSSNLLAGLIKTVQENTPETFKKHLDEYVIGQERAKQIISTAVYNHYKRVIYMDRLKAMRAAGETIPFEVPDELAKSNICMVGSSGVG